MDIEFHDCSTGASETFCALQYEFISSQPMQIQGVDTSLSELFNDQWLSAGLKIAWHHLLDQALRCSNQQQDGFDQFKCKILATGSSTCLASFSLMCQNMASFFLLDPQLLPSVSSLRKVRHSVECKMCRMLLADRYNKLSHFLSGLTCCQTCNKSPHHWRLYNPSCHQKQVQYCTGHAHCVYARHEPLPHSERPI